ncbi:hypothetical protein [Nocardia brasiliensis]|uniref:hypothetical protein n=1 Tax=Nocardia brasiliensis TaxID=37326 RepID=UPI0024579648|nr:hypothetical protein [Nocardia brasiliensis]
MIDMDAPEDVIAAAAGVCDAVCATVRHAAATVDRLDLPEAGRSCLDVAGAECVAWIRAAFEAACAEQENDVAAIHRAVVRAIGELIAADTAAGTVVRRSVGS